MAGGTQFSVISGLMIWRPWDRCRRRKPLRSPEESPYSYGNASRGAYSPPPGPSSPPPPLDFYDSSPSVAYQATGADSGGYGDGGSGSGGSSPEPYTPDAESAQHYSYDGYGYRRDRSGGSGGGGSSGGPDTGISPLRRPAPPHVLLPRCPSQQPSNDPATSEQQPSASEVTSPVGGGGGGRGSAGSTSTTPRRGLGAKISGRPSGASGSGSGSGGTPRVGATPRRPLGAPSPRGAPPAVPSARKDAGGGGGTGRGSATGNRPAVPRLPAWAPVSGIANMRLEDVDEATRVALMLNDPGIDREGVPVRSPGATHREEGAAAAAAAAEQARSPQQLPQLQLQPQQRHQASRSPGPGESPQPSPGAQHSVRSQSPNLGNRARASDVSEQFYGQYRLRKHREAHGVPDYRFSQPRSFGAHAPLQQRCFSFDEAHPAIAEQHYARSPAQERELEAERRKLWQEKARAAIAEARRQYYASPRGSPSTQQLAADVDRLASAREAGRARLRELEEEGETLRQATRQVQRRALDAIARSEQMTAAVATGSRSPSPGASPGPTRSGSRSPSRVGYYSTSASAYSRGAFGPPPPHPSLYSHSPGRLQRPASASPGGVYDSAGPSRGDGGGGLYSARAYYGSPAAAVLASLPEQQEYVGAMYRRSGQGQQQQQQSQSRPLSAPPTSQGGFGAAAPATTTATEEEAEEVLQLLQGVERLPRHEQQPAAAAGPAVDYLGRARSVATSRQDLGLLGSDEQRIAMGAYDRSRYEEYQRQVDMEMQRRAVDGDYDSDLERDEATEMLVQDSEKIAAEEEARRRAEEAEREQRDAWMDEYRQRFGPEDGYLPQRRVQSASSAGGSTAAAVRVVRCGGGAAEGALRASGVTGDAAVKLEQDLALRRAEEEEAHKRRFRAKPVPSAVIEPRYERMLLEAEAKRQLNQEQRLDELASMLERPFSFYYRDKQQLEEREALARAAKDPNRFQVSFRARDVPQSTKELEARRESTKKRVEEARQAARERAAWEAQQSREPRVFTGYSCPEKPPSQITAWFHLCCFRFAYRRKAADRAYRERLRAVDPALNPHPPKPLGAVPDFNSLHRQFEVHMAQTRANVRKRVTVPQEFALNGSTPDEQSARARKAQERRQRIILDMQLDAELLPETRWPFKSARGKASFLVPDPACKHVIFSLSAVKLQGHCVLRASDRAPVVWCIQVRRTPPPPYLVEWMINKPPDNRAASARKTSTSAAAAGGAYRTRAEMYGVAAGEVAERKVSEKLRSEALKRADRLLKAAQARRQQEAAAAGGGDGGEEFGLASDVAATAAGGVEPSDAAGSAGRGGAQRRRAAVAGRQDNPEVYVEARHAQVERRVREVVEEALLDQGIEAYRYVEGIPGDKKHKGARGG
ncbi:hypothetical protein VOLCADRAFT_103831 [Volvox carteri f. nagariensis]|uniref:Uncharacterized protein n=1 Tax=Volvox carteri f. nagariensis TaxID=3068 RepID=D8TPH6_VOLCA|nr:uncharacterized protein VOLCADRAFT_103831 [Volvox carteri f. nagariensis]EFJ50766.1 hypothetical protein VOLCADRAFT_103831 [Volvox carteri f. nagariensis]|eukprot:XP_002948359.1 hypothetical protein VOLCADRAFT_103831 [Volvox carteri f. nagariensis]